MSDPLSFDDLRAIVDALALGFQILLDKAVAQKKLEAQLRDQLERVAEKYEQLTGSCGGSSEAEIGDWRNEIVKQITPTASYEDNMTPSLSDHRITNAQTALQRLKSVQMPTVTELKKCPVAHNMNNKEDLEHDFTTHGRVGDLGCPFAQMRTGSDAQCGPDPIAEEFHGEKASGRSKSSGQAGSRCPIRFLDKHSPEEIAQYFENHKHEIPRSHQICVQRYQKNEESIRQLDAKYGSLVSMIQGLGNKHKQYLPENEKIPGEPESVSVRAVEEWAGNVSHHSKLVEGPERVPHFERPLRDVRVGESPSRPWGITIPLSKSPAASAVGAVPLVNGAQPEAQNIPIAPEAVTCKSPAHDPSAKPKRKPSQTTPQPQIVFQGPVFFGYSAEQAAIFLQHLNTSVGNVS